MKRDNRWCPWVTEEEKRVVEALTLLAWEAIANGKGVWKAKEEAIHLKATFKVGNDYYSIHKVVGGSMGGTYRKLLRKPREKKAKV